MALATSLGAEPAEPVLLELERVREARPACVVNQLLLPGRYRLELVAVQWNGTTTERRSEGPAAEVELRAGGDVRVTLR